MSKSLLLCKFLRELERSSSEWELGIIRSPLSLKNPWTYSHRIFSFKAFFMGFFFSCEVINPVVQALDLAILRDKDIIGSSFELKGPPVSLSKI